MRSRQTFPVGKCSTSSAARFNTLIFLGNRSGLPAGSAPPVARPRRRLAPCRTVSSQAERCRHFPRGERSVSVPPRPCVSRCCGARPWRRPWPRRRAPEHRSARRWLRRYKRRRVCRRAARLPNERHPVPEHDVAGWAYTRRFFGPFSVSPLRPTHPVLPRAGQRRQPWRS